MRLTFTAKQVLVATWQPASFSVLHPINLPFGDDMVNYVNYLQPICGDVGDDFLLGFPTRIAHFSVMTPGLWGDIQLIVWPHLSP